MPSEVADRMRTLAMLADRVETTCFDVIDADVATETGDACGTVSIEGEVLEEVPTNLSVAVSEARIDDQGDLKLELELSAAGTDGHTGFEESTQEDVNADPEHTDSDEVDAHTTATSEDTVESEPATNAVADRDEPDEEATPAYRDLKQLATVYDPEKTFAEMTEALDVDVTTQTVRKYMIEHGVHEPTPQPPSEDYSERMKGDRADDESEDEASSTDGDIGEESDEPDERDDDTEDSATNTDDGENQTSPIDVHAVDADGDPRDTGTRSTDATTDGGTPTHTADDGTMTALIGGQQSLSEAGVDVSAALTVDAVVGARTLYDIERAQDCDRETAGTLLTECGLLEVVRGRAADEEAATEAAVLERLEAVLATDSTRSSY